MRLNEIASNLPDDVHSMLLKLRKGMAASLDAKKTERVLSVLDGWKFEKVAMPKLSYGGWYLANEVPGGSRDSGYFRDFHKNEDGRVHFESELLTNGHQDYMKKYFEQDKQKQVFLKNTIYPALLKKAAETKPNAKFRIADVKIHESTGKGRYSSNDDTVYNKIDVSFEFWVKINVYRITSPQGDVYEVFGDYKNAAVGAQTFPQFFDWAVENTDIMEQILAVLGMEPHEKKHDPSSSWTPPRAEKAEVHHIFGILKGLTDSLAQKHYESIKEILTRQVIRYINAHQEGDENTMKAVMETDAGIIINHYKDRSGKLGDGWQAQVDKMAKETAEMIQNRFVYKNTRKLAVIVGRKANFKHHDILDIGINGYSFSGTIRFFFEDGSKFDVVNKAVGSVSNLGTYFLRFPTTFHNVVLPGGTKMAMPSEERMVDVFSVAKAGE